MLLTDSGRTHYVYIGSTWSFLGRIIQRLEVLGRILRIFRWCPGSKIFVGDFFIRPGLGLKENGIRCGSKKRVKDTRFGIDSDVE